MAMAMTPELIDAAFDMSAMCFEGKLTKQAAAQKLHKEFGMNETSAKYYVDAIFAMFAGEKYVINISLAATKRYFDRIYQEYGASPLVQALKAATLHLEEKPGNQTELKKLIEEYKKLTEGIVVLEDINKLGIDAKKKFQSEYKWREFHLSPEFTTLFEAFYKKDSSGDDADDEDEAQEEKDPLDNSTFVAIEDPTKIYFGVFTTRIVTKTKRTIDFPNQWFEMASYFTDYLAAGNKYIPIANKAYKDSGLDLEKTEKTALFNALSKAGDGWQEVFKKKYPDAFKLFLKSLQDQLPSKQDFDLFVTCLSKKGWSHSTKTIFRRDYIRTGILRLSGVVNNSQNHISYIAQTLAENPSLLSLLKRDLQAPQEGKPMPVVVQPVATGTSKGNGKNLIVYGAPGSGKSHYIRKELVKNSPVLRTVFHPEYQNADFIGGLKPSRDGKSITYSFVPGVFTEALLMADKDKEADVYLIIEEINRANAAAVFGDVFQLLDRKNGLSEYHITPEQNWKQYLIEKGYDTPDKVQLPPNLHLVATMNSSDQGVFLLDAAFKRRWQFHYCKIDFSAHASIPGFTELIVPYKGVSYSWTDFAGALNNALKLKGIEEDRMIGPFFLTSEELKDTETCKEAIAGKLLIFLWDDVVRHDRKKLFRNEITTFSDLINSYNEDKSIFQSQVEGFLSDASEKKLAA